MIRFKVRINNKHAAQCNTSDYRKARWQEAMLPVLQREKRRLRGSQLALGCPAGELGLHPIRLVPKTLCLPRYVWGGPPGSDLSHHSRSAQWVTVWSQPHPLNGSC